MAGKPLSSRMQKLLHEPNSIHTRQGWQTWRLATAALQQPAATTATALEAMASAELVPYNLARDIWHANLPRPVTAQTAPIYDNLRVLLKMNTYDFSPGVRPGMFISGLGAEGKSTLVMQVASEFESVLEYLDPGPAPGTRDAQVLVAYIAMPSTPTVKNLCRRILKFYGETFRVTETQDELVTRVRDVMTACRTRILVIDDVSRLQLARQSDREVSDLLRELMETGATLICVGINVVGAGILMEGEVYKPNWDVIAPDEDQVTQTQRRFLLEHLRPFPAANDGWRQHLQAIESNLRLAKAAEDVLSNDETAEYLYSLTSGVVGRLQFIIRQCALRAVGGSENITAADLARVRRDFDAEYQTIGQQPARGPKKAAGATRRPARTVLQGVRAHDRPSEFDDDEGSSD